MHATTTSKPRTRKSGAASEATAHPSRVIVENLRPQVDGGRYAVKRTVGETLEVLADAFADGHDRLRVVLRHRAADAKAWTEVEMEPLGNDLWRAAFPVDAPGFHEYAVAGWIDRFATWREELEKKAGAGQDVASELLEGAALVRAAAARAKAAARKGLEERAAVLGGSAPQGERVAAALDPDLASTMRGLDDRAGACEHPAMRLWADRERARFGAWYEMFPRSAGPAEARGATLREAAGRFPAIAAMGFDVVYLPPIHPIGRTHRKGPNNTLKAGPGDPGSPWAIGAAEGGHDAVHPELGTLADFDAFVAEAARHGLEIALDIAFQCSPDHPWVREHPEWFRHRPDGSIKYAENPPKKYQDIFPLHFECEAWESLWAELRRVVMFWVGHGVKVFRVDNPHTKPIRFWEWLIAEVQRDHPEVVFLSEAFTRPKVMRALAKAGFTQSYSYFTWRNTKQELTEYFTELTRTESREYMRPNLFANTPDILHEYLQTGGRAGFEVRFVLAATLGASYGIYGPAFELCEGRAVPGSEEYVDSEKYQVRAWDHDAPNIRGTIAKVNAARREHPALQHDHHLTFVPTDNDALLAYTKTSPDGADTVLVVVNLDPHHPQDGWLELPLADLGMDDAQPFQVHDQLDGTRYLWQGPRNYVRLDPAACPAHVFVVRRRIRTERDFDYYQ